MKGKQNTRLLITVIQLLLINSVLAQRPPAPPINLGYFQFDFIQTGARRAALGGAFIGAAQDETAGIINPAGLTYLKSAGVSLHARIFNINNRFDSDQFVIAAFFPIKKINIAFAREHWLNSRFDFETDQFLTKDFNFTNRQVLGGLGNFPGKKVYMDFQLILDRLSVGYEFSKRLGLGISILNETLEMNFSEQLYLDSQIANGSLPRKNLPETNYSNTTLGKSDGLVWGFSLGLMVTVIPDKLFLGTIVDFNPSFNNFKSDIFLPEYELGLQSFPAESPKDTSIRLSIPDAYGFGLYYRANSRLNFTLDIVRREYSDLLIGNDLNIPADDVLNELTNKYEDPDAKPDLTVADASEIHFGLEWLFRVPKWGKIFPLRFGMFTDPGNRIHAVKKDADLRRLYPKEIDKVHFTFGIGVVGSNYYKYDIGANISRDGWQLFLSGTFTIPEY